jgi:hypothetical protein
MHPIRRLLHLQPSMVTKTAYANQRALSGVTSSRATRRPHTGGGHNGKSNVRFPSDTVSFWFYCGLFCHPYLPSVNVGRALGDRCGPVCAFPDGTYPSLQSADGDLIGLLGRRLGNCVCPDRGLLRPPRWLLGNDYSIRWYPPFAGSPTDSVSPEGVAPGRGLASSFAPHGIPH